MAASRVQKHTWSKVNMEREKTGSFIQSDRQVSPSNVKAEKSGRREKEMKIEDRTKNNKIR